ncbi:protocatechuate 3,4-dioxygenase beta subunit [Xylaria cubensis]|nr:protocatechuate 3,4-dioxygenase beta subunit [Xylaria cubensis]
MIPETDIPTDGKSEAHLPTAMDLDTDNITQSVIDFFSQGQDERMRFILDRLVNHIHDFARETKLTTDEWRVGLDWLQACGQICTNDRKELITVSDIFGLSTLVEEINHPKPPGATEGSILGPFHSLEAETKSNGDPISEDVGGEPLFVLCTIKDTSGTPIPNVKVHVWEADSHGEYDIEKSNRTKPDGRGIFYSDEQGTFYFNGIVPVPYPILCDGPVGRLFEVSGRHEYRPAHIHFMFEKDGYDNLITALYIQGSKYCDSDAVFGVKQSLVVSIQKMDSETATEYGQTDARSILRYEFVLATDMETEALKKSGFLAVNGTEDGYHGIQP